MQELVDDFSIEIGCRCNSAAVVLEPDDDRSLHEHPRESKGRPGSRAPHVFVPRDGHGCRRSTCSARGSCCWPGPTALRGARRPGGRRALGVPLDGYVIGDAASGFAEAYGISQPARCWSGPMESWPGARWTPRALRRATVRDVLRTLLCRDRTGG